MKSENNFLVVGGDSLVGRGLFAALKKRGRPALSTTRRRQTINAEKIYLDFEGNSGFQVPEGIQYAFLVAAATNYERCEKDPCAHHINVELIPKVVASLLEQNVFVTFVSTNTVFGGDRPCPREDDPHEPGIAYARQKSLAERKIREMAGQLNALDRFNVVRLTKILSNDTSPLPSWLSAWRRFEIVEPFSDLIFAPMSVQFVSEALATIGEKRIPGNLHLSGAANVTYVDLAHAIAVKLNIDPRVIRATTATEKGVNILFKPRHSALDMQHTTNLTGVKPQSLAQVVDDLLPGE